MIQAWHETLNIIMNDRTSPHATLKEKWKKDGIDGKAFWSRWT